MSQPLSEPPKTMLALHLTRAIPSSPPLLTLSHLPVPILGPNEVLLKIHASPLHPSDILNVSGLFPQTSFPVIPGRDYSGTIISSSSNNKSLMGRAVYGTSGNVLSFTQDGAQAEYLVMKEEDLAFKPDALTWVQAACVGVPFTTAGMAIKRGEVRSGESVLVLGANGAVGSAACQIARSRGAKVFRGVRGDAGDVNTAADPALKALDELMGGRGVDVVIDTVGQPALTAAAAEKLGRGGRLVFIAGPRMGSTTLEIEMVGFYRSEKRLIGVNTLNYGVGEFAEELRELKPLFESGALKVEGEWTPMKLEEGVEAYEKAGRRGGGKIVLVMS